MANPTGIVTASILNLRASASTAAALVGRLPRGTAVEIVGRSGAWLQVHSPAGDGFVHGDFVSVVEMQHAAGFLFERADLRAVPLAPPDTDLIKLASGGTAAQRTVAQAWNTQGGLLQALSDRVELEPAASVAVLCVESGGKGFAADGRMIIRFENHVFWDRWGQTHAEDFNAHFRFNPQKRWLGHQFRENPAGAWQPCHTSQDVEWQVLTFARGLDDRAGLVSISMGGPQIMGFNSHLIGYEDPETMFANFSADLRFQVLGLFDFVKGAGTTSKMLEALKRQRFNDFASFYNGPGQAAEYGSRIQSFYGVFQGLRG
jgi:N-acetylmuramidase/Bacterial SH3 domain